jgi:hypothetical protein
LVRSSVEAIAERVAELQQRTKELERRLRAGAAGGRRPPAEVARGAQSVNGTRFAGMPRRSTR